MKIVDLRPFVVSKWQRSADRCGDGGAVGRLWTGLVDRYLAGRAARRQDPPAGLQVVSVGNLALGGTGKTPVTMALARDLAARGRKGAVLTRGYGSRLRGPIVVEPDLDEAGDEARLMASTLADTGWIVVQSRDRKVGLDWLAERWSAPATVLLEDGYQNAAARHLDVLILDRWRIEGPTGAPVLVPETGAVAPWGSWRESAPGAERADILLVEDGAAPDRSRTGQPVATFARGLRLEGESPVDGSWLALSGIARPESFEQGAAELIGRGPDTVIRCRDHAAYDGRLGERVLATVRAAGHVTTVTTAKDWIKLRGFWPAELPVAIVCQDLVWTGKQTLPALVRERLQNR